MLNFELYNPTRLLYGKGQIASIGQLILPNSKILLAYGGGSIFKNGVYNQVTEALKDFEVIEFGGIEPNPHYETLVKAVELIKKNKIDFILGVGGGSVIDGVKFISAAVHYEGDSKEIILNKMNVNWQTVPYGAVLTLPATGSEMNNGAVVTIAESNDKLSFSGEPLYPLFSICDPTVVSSLPQRQIANGLADSFVHVLEQYITYPQNAPLQDRFAESILSVILEVAPAILSDPADYDAATTYMWACTMALNGLIAMGVKEDWVTHAIGHELTALYGIDHGRTLAIIGPNLYQVMFDTKKEKLAQLGRRVFSISEGSEEEIAKKAIEALVAFFHSLEIKTKLSDYTADYLQTSDIIVNRFRSRGWLAMGEQKNITLDKIKEIVELSY
ncbi:MULTISPECIES: iron-containing alcohol dehydrogenase [Myroides]|uniref:Iron-containing alcohol dehydrogenase n=1 Tax=Myroides albus TaxID=2562892 RepID=A0A6I3LKP4_9FLAO|nr:MULTISPECIES: iron-containing alcohol dehydrogenase [Myroides]MTG96585.1 iron-containing alcohol dehydrogenase [Myroides albus]MVX34581.1 iron-containing alcohol dehydrogenase [Myroides sp. LoEW2-1]UVD81002.1 iron-containing alcohol dehydrogenase [Myroides albus]